MSILARLLDHNSYAPEGLPEYRPSVSLHRLVNTPDAEDYDADAMSCRDCGSQSITTEWRQISAQTREEPAEHDIYATCECGSSWPVDDIRDLGARQQPS